MGRRCFQLRTNRRLLFAGFGRDAIYALDRPTGRVLAFDERWAMRTCARLEWPGDVYRVWLVGERADGPCFYTQHTGVGLFHRPGQEAVAGLQLFSPLDASEHRDFWVRQEDGSVMRVADEFRITIATPAPGLHALPTGLLDAPFVGPVTLYPFDGSPPRVAKLTKMTDIAHHGDSIFTSHFGGAVVELSASTLEERGRASFNGDAIHLHATEGALLVETNDTLHVLGRIDDEPRAVARNVRPFRVVVSRGRWMCLNLPTPDDGSAYVATSTSAPRFVHIDASIHEAFASTEGVLLVERDEWTFIAWDTLLAPSAEASVVFERGQPVVGAPHTLEAKVLLAGATILRLSIVSSEGGLEGQTATIPSGGNPLGLVVGDVVRVDAHVDRERLVVERIVPPSDEDAITEDQMKPLSTRTILRFDGHDAPPWMAVLLRHGLIDSADAVPPDLWRRTPLEALLIIYAPRAGIAHRFVHYDHRVYDDTDDPAADFAALAGVTADELGVSAKLDGDDEETVALRVRGKDGATKVTPFDIEDVLAATRDAVNAALAERGASRRIYECSTEHDGYAFIACTADEARSLASAGLETFE